MPRSDPPDDDASADALPPDLRVSGLPIKDVFEQMAQNPEVDPPTGTNDAKPRRFGDYELIKIIAEGGTGVVWEARQIGVNRRVAIKIMRAGEWVGEDAVSRFIAEAEVVSLLEHKHITPIYDVGEVNSVPYLAMPLYTSGNLGDHLTRIQSDPRQVAALVATIASALQHAHSRGILHRDLKPSNILLDPADEPHVADFGLGRNLNEASKLTTASSVLGSLVYLAPESLSAQAPTLAIDVYGLGTILYECLTGQPPYSGQHVAEILALIGHEDPVAPSQLRPGLDRDLSIICQKCLARDPAARYPSAQAVADDLRNWLEYRPISARPASLPERLTKWVRRHRALAALIAIAPVGLGLFLTLTHHHDQQLTQAQGDAISSQTELADVDRRQRFATIESRLVDGRQREAIAGLTALLRDDPSDLAASARLHLVLSARRFALPLLHTVESEQPLIEGLLSPDAQHILLLGAHGGFRLQSLAGADSGWQHQDTLFADGRFEDNDGGFRLIANDGNLTRWSRRDLSTPIESTPLQAVEESREWLVARPDVSRLRQHVVADGRSPFRRGQLFDTGGEGAKKVIWRIRSTWGPHGDQVTAWPFQSTSFSTYATATGAPLAKNMMLGASVMAADFSPDGDAMWSGDPRGRLTRWDLGNGEISVQTATGDDLPLTQVLASPDGRLVAARSIDRKLWIFDALALDWLHLPLALPDKVGAFAFNADGTQLAISLVNGQIQILDTKTFEPAVETLISAGLATSLSYAREADKLLIVIDSGQVELWDTSIPRSPSSTWTSSSPLLGDTLIDPAGDFAIVARESHLARVSLRDETAPELTLLKGETRVVRSLAVNADRTRLVAALTDHEVTEIVRWRLPEFDLLSRESHDFVSLDVAFTPDGNSLLSFDPKGSLHVIPEQGSTEAAAIQGQSGANIPHTVSADGSCVAMILPDGEIHIIDPSNHQNIATLPLPRSPVARLQFGSTANDLYVASQNGTVQRWSWIDQSATAGPPLPHSSAVSALLADPRGEILYSGTHHGAITQWQPMEGTSRVFTAVNAKSISALSLSPDGRWLASGSTDGAVQIWHIASGLPVSRQTPLNSSVLRLQWDSAAHRLLAITRDGTVHAQDFSPPTNPASPDQLALIESAIGLEEIDDDLLYPVDYQLFIDSTKRPTTPHHTDQSPWWTTSVPPQALKVK